MKVILMHNPTSGHQPHSKKRLMKPLKEAGFDPDYQSTDEDDFHKVLKKGYDLVVVAGGDGTIGKVGAHLLDQNIPMAILPIGTANNIAHSLGMLHSMHDIINGLSVAPRVPFDVGMSNGPWGNAPFFEGIGVGLIPHVMNSQELRRDEEKLNEKSGQEELRNDLLAFIKHTGSFPSLSMTVTIDDRKFTGKYLLVEILNIGYVGPHIMLAPEASTKDGYLDVLLVPENKRHVLESYLRSRLAGEKMAHALDVERGKHIHITFDDPESAWEDLVVHIDGKIWPKKKPNGLDKVSKNAREIDLTIKKHALQFLVPI